MAASSRTEPANTSRKIWILGAVIVAVILIYTGGWFYAANEMKSRLTTLLAGGNENGVSAECQDMDFRGYPFRIGLFCSDVRVDDHRNGISASFGALRSAAQIYAPWHVVWELDQPAVVRTASGITVSTEWSSLQSSLTAGLDGLERSSLIASDIKGSVVSMLAGDTLTFDAKRGEVHLRQNGNNLDAAILSEATNITVKDQPQLLPAISTSADLTLTDKAGLLNGTNPDGANLRGTSGLLNRLVADLGQGRVMTLSGPFSFDEEGYLTSELTLEIENIDAWREALKSAFPAAAKTIDTAGNMLTALVSGGTKASVKLSVNKGTVFVSGFIKIGKIPPV